MKPARTALRRMIQSAGYDVVRVKVDPRDARPAPGDSQAGSRREFFPTESEPRKYQPWPIPADLKNRTDPWAQVLIKLYKRPASWPSCVSPETGMLINALIRNIRPRTVVETGTCHGASTIWIAAAMVAAADSADPDKAGMIHTFDDYMPPPSPRVAALPLFQNRRFRVARRFKECGFDRMIMIHEGDSSTNIVSARPAIDASGGIQFAFIDGDHSADGVLKDFEAIEPSLNVGGYILLHDVFPAQCKCAGPRWLADNIQQAAGGEYELIDLYTAPLNYGVTLLRRVT